jgi:hypothetical protein
MACYGCVSYSLYKNILISSSTSFFFVEAPFYLQSVCVCVCVCVFVCVYIYIYIYIYICTFSKLVDFLRSRAQPVLSADNLTAICEPIV